MKLNYTPLRTSVLLTIISASLFFLFSFSAYAATAKGKTTHVKPNPQELFAASLKGDLRTVQRLVKERINVNHVNSDGETALHMAASRGHLSIVIFLLNNSANINARTRNNWIPLHHAVRFNRQRVANYLMAKGAPPHYKTGDGLDSFDIAVNMSNQRMINMVQGHMNRR